MKFWYRIAKLIITLNGFWYKTKVSIREYSNLFKFLFLKDKEVEK